MKLYTLDETCLENARAGLKQPFSPLQLALSKLVSEADILRREAPESVVHKAAPGQRRRARLLQSGHLLVAESAAAQRVALYSSRRAYQSAM